MTNKWTREEYKQFRESQPKIDSIRIITDENLSWGNVTDRMVANALGKNTEGVEIPFEIYPILIQRLGYPVLGVIMDN